MLVIELVVIFLAIAVVAGVAMANNAYTERNAWRGRFYNVADANVHLAEEMKKLRNDLAELEQKYSWACPDCVGPERIAIHTYCAACNGTQKVWMDSAAHVHKTLTDMAKLPKNKPLEFAAIALRGVLRGSNQVLETYQSYRQIRDKMGLITASTKKKRSKKS